jgi:CheY-like chemotaxis protein
MSHNKAGQLIASTYHDRDEHAGTPSRAGLELSPQGNWRVGDRAFAGTTFLVVDDDVRNNYAITALLERGHADVVTAISGHDGITILNQTTVDIVLMDIMMPEMDGYETIRIVRDFDRFKALPIIAVTGKATPDERDRCLAAGANDFVAKPVMTVELVEAISPWLP